MTDLLRILWLVALVAVLFLMAGCGANPSIPDNAAICTATLEDRKEHARALVKAFGGSSAGGDGARALITGQHLLSAMHEACQSK